MADQSAGHATAPSDVMRAFENLSDADKLVVVRGLTGLQGLPPPPARDVVSLWYLIVGAFVVLLLGSGLVLYFEVKAGNPTSVFEALATGALGALAGLLAPSPVDPRRTDGK
jgi:hypothetical protein